MSEGGWAGWQSEWAGPPAAPDPAGARREARAGQDAYRQAWEAGYEAARADQAQWHPEAQQGHPYRRAAAMGLVAGVAAREGVGGIGRALGAIVVVLGVVVMALVAVAIVAPSSTALVVWLAMGGAVVSLVRRHRGRQGSGY